MDVEPAVPAALSHGPGHAFNRLRAYLARRHPALALLVLTTLYLSTQMLLQGTLFGLWSWQEIVIAWLAYWVELALLVLLMYAVNLAVDAACLRCGAGRWWRLVVLALAFYAAAFGFALAAAAWRHVRAARPDFGVAAALAANWAVIAVYMAVVQALWRRAAEADVEALGLQRAGEALERESRQLRLQLLKAQIEPHFLFNTLANMRQLYRQEPARAVSMMRSLQSYLRAALPSLRRDDATLETELELVRAYLMLIGMRMAGRLNWRVHDSSGCAALPFPPMVVLTLVENAIRHGLEPLPAGGHVDVMVSVAAGWLEVRVRDDGVGFGVAQSGGSGVGLANVRSQLRVRFGSRARLALSARERGVEALILVPLSS